MASGFEYVTAQPERRAAPAEQIAQVSLAGDQAPQRGIVCLGVFAVCFNGLLAFVNAHIVGTPQAAVIACEMLILATALGLILRCRTHEPRDFAVMLLLGVHTLLAVLMSIGNDRIYLDGVRNILIVGIFFALGIRCNDATIRRMYAIITGVVLAFLLVEVFFLDFYVQIFQPALYYSVSRGYAISQFSDLGLFSSAEGFQGRFTLGLFSGPRTSSIFVEQVSLANYAAVLCIYLSTMWGRLNRIERFAHVGLVLFILATNNSRTSSALLVVLLVGYWVFPMLPRFFTLALAPLTIIAAFVIAGPKTSGAALNDDLVGRLSVTASDFYYSQVGWYIGGGLDKAGHSYDSGYMYLIASTSALGFLVYYLFVNFAPAGGSAAHQRSVWSLNLYTWLWLVIGGTALFTMKTSPILWLLIGHMAALAASNLKVKGSLPDQIRPAPLSPRLNAQPTP